MQVEQYKYQPHSRWSVLFLSLIFAMILSMAFISTLSADDHDTDDRTNETDGTELNEENRASGRNSPNAQDASITGTLSVSATVEVTHTEQYTSYLPVMFTPLESPQLSVVKPNSSNQWQINWNSVGDGATYQIQESQDPDFQDLLSDETIPNTSKNFQHEPSPYNSYFYRVRTLYGSLKSGWSIVKINGAYRDDFNENHGWAMRRTSLLPWVLDKYYVIYDSENWPGNLIIILDDRFDWFLASPMAQAPEVPYVIEYRSRNHLDANLVSGGIVLGGDWNGGPCPDLNNLYNSNTCFNHFYTYNYIWHGPITLLFERVDALRFCKDLDCPGSQLKRTGDINETWPAFEVIDPAASLDWHTYRVEVRETGMKLYIDGKFVREFIDSNYVHDPYFGVFASAEEYRQSIWFYDYIEVTPLD